MSLETQEVICKGAKTMQDLLVSIIWILVFLAVVLLQVGVSQIWIGFKPERLVLYLAEEFVAYVAVGLYFEEQRAALMVVAIALGTIASFLWTFVLLPRMPQPEVVEEMPYDDGRFTYAGPQDVRKLRY